MSAKCSLGFHIWCRVWLSNREMWYRCPRCNTWAKSRWFSVRRHKYQPY